MPPPYAIRVRTSSGWQDIAIQGAQGTPGIGVPIGGAPGQALLKNGASDFDTTWGVAGVPPEVKIGPTAPTGTEVLWLDTDEPAPPGRPPLVTSLPGSPVEGQEVYFDADPAGGVIWHLRYDATILDAWKWEFVGGPAIWAEQDGTVNSVATHSTYQTAGTMTLTVPVAGVYMIEWSAQISTAAISGNGGFVSANGCGIGATDAYAAFISTAAAVVVTSVGQGWRRASLTTGALGLYMRSSAAGVGQIAVDRKRLRVTPVRLG